MSAAVIITELVHEAIKLAGGEKTPEKLAASIAERVQEAVIEAIHRELRQAYAILGLTIAFQDLSEVMSTLLRRMREAESGGGLPRILDGAQVEQVDEITDEDRAREKAGFEALKAKP